MDVVWTFITHQAPDSKGLKTVNIDFSNSTKHQIEIFDCWRDDLYPCHVVFMISVVLTR